VARVFDSSGVTYARVVVVGPNVCIHTFPTESEPHLPPQVFLIPIRLFEEVFAEARAEIAVDKGRVKSEVERLTSPTAT